MRPAPAGWDRLITRSGVLRPVTEVTSWLDGRYLGAIPVKSGKVTETGSDLVAGRLELTVPNVARWRPATAGHPLAPYGQQLRVRVGRKNGQGKVVAWFDLGRYRIRKPTVSGDVLQVPGDSLEQLIVGAQFYKPTVLPASTYKVRARYLLKSILPVSVDAALPDRAVGKLLVEQDRMQALADLLTAWPARMEILPSGAARISTAYDRLPKTAVTTVTDGPGGTLVDVAPESASADDLPNVMVATGETSDDKEPPRGVAYTRSGPLRLGGPYGSVVAFYSSPLLTTTAQAQKAAQTRLDSIQDQALQVQVQMVDDPRLQRGDVIRVKSARRDTDVTGRITGLEHGLTAADMATVQVSLTVLSGRVDGQAVIL